MIGIRLADAVARECVEVWANGRGNTHGSTEMTINYKSGTLHSQGPLSRLLHPIVGCFLWKSKKSFIMAKIRLPLEIASLENWGFNSRVISMACSSDIDGSCARRNTKVDITCRSSAENLLSCLTNPFVLEISCFPLGMVSSTLLT